MITKQPRQDSLTLRLEFTASARNAWKTILQTIAATRRVPLRVLLPAYIGQTQREGSGVFDPIRETNSSYQFYSLDKLLTPNSDELERIAKTSQVDVLLVIHYFGFSRLDMTQTRKLCDEHEIILVEDCAHVGPYFDSNIGGNGQYSFYSLHKHFSVESGGILRCNDWTVEWAGDNECDNCPREVLEQVLRSDREQIASHRRANYHFLENAFSKQKFARPLWKLSKGTVPHSFPLIIANAHREELYFHLLKRGMPTTALYYQLVDELNPTQFPLSFELSNRILNLPVHQDTSITDLEKLVAEIEAFFDR